jgi:hypothetical protein
MNIRKILVSLTLSTAICSALTSCSNSKKEVSVLESSVSVSSENDSDTSSAQEVELETAYSAESGDAYLAVVDGQWWVQYWGSADDDGAMLSYDAGIAHINGNGEYTVSVNCDTKGYRYTTTGSTEAGTLPTGCKLAAVIVKDGTALYPNMAITVTNVKVNGEDVPLIANNYTASDDGVEMRANIYNPWVSSLPTDAHNAEGQITDDSTFSSEIIDSSVFDSSWSKIEVTFTVTGITT